MFRIRRCPLALLVPLALACSDGAGPEDGSVDGGPDVGVDSGVSDGGSEDAGSPDQGPTDQGVSDGGGPVDLPGTMMGLVMSADGTPVPGASFAGSANLTDSNGMVYGDVEIGGGGYVRVTAPGFASGFAPQIATLGDWDFYETFLTPVGAMRMFEAGDTRSLIVGDAAAPLAAMQLSAADLERPEAIVELTVIEPIDVGPLFAPLSGGQELYLTKAFALTAHDRNDDAVALAPGAAATVHIAGHFTPGRVLAEFNPDSGTWDVMTPGCALAMEEIECVVDRSAPLFGIFDVMPPPFLSSNVRGLRANAADYGVSDEDYKGARARFDRAYQSWQAAGGALPAPDSVNTALDELIEAAKAYAKDNPSEAGKTHLTGAAQAALDAGNQAAADATLGEARKIADEIADDLLDSSNCARLQETLIAAQQCELLGSTKTQALIDKAKELFNKCMVWVGHISIRMRQGDTFAGLDDFTTVSNPDWSEQHDVRLGINPETKVVTGESKVGISLGNCRFEANHDSCCGPPYIIELWGDGSRSLVLFQGTFDLESQVWTFNPPQPHNTSGSASLKRHDKVTIETNDDPCACMTAQDFTATITDKYTSVMVHGFQGVPITPTLAEMLNNGAKSFDQDGHMISSRGFEEVTLEFQEGLLALTGKAWVSWSLFRADIY